MTLYLILQLVLVVLNLWNVIRGLFVGSYPRVVTYSRNDDSLALLLVLAVLTWTIALLAGA